MIAAMLGFLNPITDALCQDLIVVLAVIIALLVAIRPRLLSDYQQETNDSNSIQS